MEAGPAGPWRPVQEIERGTGQGAPSQYTGHHYNDDLRKKTYSYLKRWYKCDANKCLNTQNHLPLQNMNMLQTNLCIRNIWISQYFLNSDLGLIFFQLKTSEVLIQSNNDIVACKAGQSKFWRNSFTFSLHTAKVQYAGFAIIGREENIHRCAAALPNIFVFVFPSALPSTQLIFIQPW